MELLPLLLLNDLQKQIIQKLLHETERKQLSMRFNEPEKDALQLRQHAAFDGMREAYETLLTWDAVTLAQNAEKVQQTGEQ